MKKIFSPNNIFQRFKGLFSIGLSDILGAGISSLFWLYMATVIGPESYGELFYYFAIGNIAVSISLLGSTNTLMVYIPKNIKLVSTIFFLTIVLSFIISLIVFLIYSHFIIGFYILGAVIFGLGTAELLAKKLYTNYFVLLITQKLLMVGLSLGLYHYVGMSGIILGIGISFLPYLVIIIKEFKTSKIDFSLLKPRLGFISSSFGQNLLATFSNQTDKLIIAPLLGFTLLGNYQLGIQFIAVFQLLPLIVMKFTLPHDATGRSNKNLKIITVLISIGFTALIIFISPILIPMFFDDFIFIVDITQILSLSLTPMAISSAYSSKFLGAEKSKIVFAAMGVLLISHICGILILGNILGIVGIAISYVLAMTIHAIFYFIMDLRKIESKP